MEHVGTELIQIEVNGESRMTSRGGTITGLLRELQIRPDRVAVEVNLQIVDRQDFERHALQGGDRVEVISFIGGGGGVGQMRQDASSPGAECARSTVAVAATLPYPRDLGEKFQW